jgi:lysophospholipase L1-like esterase
MPSSRPPVALLFTALVLALLLSEGALRLFNYQLSSYGQRYNILLHFDRSILFRNAPSSAPDIDQQGRRVTRIPPLPQELPQVLLLGDSFTFGVGGESGDSFPSQLQARLKETRAVSNYGVIGYGPDQSLLQLEGVSPLQSQDTVILSLFAGNDFEDIIKNQLFTLDSTGVLRASAENILTPYLPRSKVMLLLYRGFYGRDLIPQRVMNTLFEDPEKSLSHLAHSEQRARVDLLRGVLLRLKRASTPAKFAVNLIPPAGYYRAPLDFSANVQVVKDLSSELNIALVSVETILDEGAYLEKDGHLTPQGNDRVAEQLARFIATE